MMSRYYLSQDTKKCIGCHSCEVACKSNKDLPVGPKLCEIITVGPVFVGGLPKAGYTFMPCFHCEDPWCVAACPTGAMQKRDKDGIVFVDPALCVGCKTCMSACPWGAPQWNPETGKAVKCDFCMDRLDKGLEPCLCYGVHHQVSSVRTGRKGPENKTGTLCKGHDLPGIARACSVVIFLQQDRFRMKSYVRQNMPCCRHRKAAVRCHRWRATEECQGQAAG